MIETLISFGVIVIFSLAGWALAAGGESLIWGGVGLAVVGFAYGIPAAIVYHWRLYRSLNKIDRLPARWWLQPTALHDRLPRDDRFGVLFWGAVGGSGFLVIVLGIILTVLGLWRLF